MLLQPKPTHPTSDQTNQPQPVYDTLTPSGRESFTVSIGSGKELPNPLYSGLAKSSRPNSQLQDSGSGTVHSQDNTGKGTEDEPLYSEANMPSTNEGVYTEPDKNITRSSQLLSDTSPPPSHSHPNDPLIVTPPPPPDPRTIPNTSSPPSNPSHLQPNELADPNNTPMYAEPNLGSQEHLYSELPDPQHPQNNNSPPIFHTPPPPLTKPPPSKETSGELPNTTPESN